MTSAAGKSHFLSAWRTTLKQSSMSSVISPFVAHLDLIASLLHQFQRELHGQPQLPRIDQAAQVAFHFAVGFVVVVEVAVDVPLVEVGRVGDGLARRGDQFVGRRRHVKPGSELPENAAVRLGQFQQNIHQFRFLAPGQCWRAARPRGPGCFRAGAALLGRTSGHGIVDSVGLSGRSTRRPARRSLNAAPVVPGHPALGAGRNLRRRAAATRSGSRTGWPRSTGRCRSGS